MGMAGGSEGSGETSGGPSTVPDALVDAALLIIATDGFDALSVRKLGVATHYSASAVAYHVSPMNRFASQLWYELHRRVPVALVDAAVRAHPPGSEPNRWADEAAAAWMSWADSNPGLAEFYVAFRPEPDHVTISVAPWGVSPAVWDRAGDRLRHQWWYHARSMQAALERAQRAEPGSARVATLAADMIRNARGWTDALAEAPSDESPEEG